MTTGFDSDNEIYRLKRKFEIPNPDYLERRLPVSEIRPDLWMDYSSIEVLSASGMVEKYADVLPDHIVSEITLPPWLREAVSSVDVHLIEPQNLSPLEEYSYSEFNSIQKWGPRQSKIEKRAKHLADHISNLLRQYANNSQIIDQTFPHRIVNHPNNEELSETEIREEIRMLSQRYNCLVSTGIIKEMSEFSESFDAIEKGIELTDHNIRKILSIYIRDVKLKLEIFSEASEKIQMFQDIVNRNFSIKSIKVDSNRGISSVDNKSGKIIPLRELSIGEQHQIAIIYDLLFQIKVGSTVLINQPEAWLHVAWQLEFLPDVERIKQINHMNVLIATHSPQIIHDRWDAVLEFGDN